MEMIHTLMTLVLVYTIIGLSPACLIELESEEFGGKRGRPEPLELFVSTHAVVVFVIW